MSGAAKYRILVTEPVAEEGLNLLRREGFDVRVELGPEPDRLIELVEDAHGLIVRGATRVTAKVLEASRALKIVGRAGSGVDNIDLAAATARGVVVVNTPGGNSVSVAELALGLMLACARKICHADGRLKSGQWVKKECRGIELNGKTIGIVGMGRIGRQVAKRAVAFGMKVLGYDPFIAKEKISELGAEPVDLPDLLERSHVVTLHVPLTERSRAIIDAEAISRMRSDAILINTSRGGLVDERALLEALDSGRLWAAGLDAFENEPNPLPELVGHPRVVATPHIGASTREAQEQVGYHVASTIADYLLRGELRNAVNYTSVSAEQMHRIQPYLVLAERLGAFCSQIAVGRMKRLEFTYGGDLARESYGLLTDRALCGGLRPFLNDFDVNPVSARTLAADRGMEVVEAAESGPAGKSPSMAIVMKGESGVVSVVGGLSGQGRPRLLEVDGIPLDAPLEGTIVFLRPADVPGVVGKLGSYLGDRSINITNLALQTDGKGSAVAVASVEGPVTREIVYGLRQFAEIPFSRLVRLAS
ncbi:MAG: phosphoglycerate dehydrogenase [Deltaproteobacteria bacterium]|nr:MAG: phosphoglycerate dehydrogenase [Deltaproteobacteria bacterium]